MIRMENISDRELLQAYLQAKYPKQMPNMAVCVIKLDEIEFDGEREELIGALAQCGIMLGGFIGHPGNLIVEMNQGMLNALCNQFNKAGFTILVYKDGEIINENM